MSTTPSRWAITTRNGALAAASPNHDAIPLAAAAPSTSVLARAETNPWVLVGGDAPLVHLVDGALAPFVRALSPRTCVASTHTAGWASACGSIAPTIVPTMPTIELPDGT